MGEYFTPNYGSDADETALKLAKVNLAGGVYVWLHSRAWVFGNAIMCSNAFLADTFGTDKSTMRRAVGRLRDAGLIRTYSKAGNSGHTYYSVVFPESSPLLDSKGGDAPPLNGGIALQKLHDTPSKGGDTPP